MPLYEYECFLCRHRFERIQRASDASVPSCPACGGSVRRLLSAPALQFKGSGWYVTDYGKGTGGAAGEKPPEKKDKETAATTGEPATASKKDTPSKRDTPSSGSAKGGDTT